MSYTKTKVTYIGTNEEEIELQSKDLKPDYYEYDQAISNGNLKTNYDPLQTAWRQGQMGNPSNDRPVMGENNYGVGGGYFNEWLGQPDEEFHKTRPDYNPRSEYVVKGIHLKYDGRSETHINNADNFNIPHFGDGNNTTARSSHVTSLDGLWCNYTPVLNDSLIKVSCKYTAYSVNGSYPIWLWSLFVGNRWTNGGWERHYAMGTKTIHHEVYLNSWGSGKQVEVNFGFNSYNNSHRVGFYSNTLPSYSRYISVEEYRNPNPYGPAVMEWSKTTATNL